MKFRCDQPGCEYATAIRCRFEDHLSSHVGLLNHVCSFCGKTFSHRKHLQRHEQGHDFQCLRACPRCNYRSARSDKLKAHIRAKHKDLDLASVDLGQKVTTKPNRKSTVVQQTTTPSQGCQSLHVDHINVSSHTAVAHTAYNILVTQETTDHPVGPHDGLAQSCGNSSTLAMELPQPCAKPLIWRTVLWLYSGRRRRPP